ncbi:hypothetical protein [Streptomyces sp. NPDC002758]
MPDIVSSATTDDTKPTAYDTLMALLKNGGAESHTQAVIAVADFRQQVEREARQQQVKDALLKLHEWDELIFGGFYCMHCTPDDADDPDQNVYWPCPPLREVGVTNAEAVALISAHRAAIEAKHRAKAEAGDR